MFPEVERELPDITVLCWNRARPIKLTGSQNAQQKPAACVSYQSFKYLSQCESNYQQPLFVQTKAAMFKACLSLILISSLGKGVQEIQIRTCHPSVKDVCVCVCVGRLCAGLFASTSEYLSDSNCQRMRKHKNFFLQQHSSEKKYLNFSFSMNFHLLFFFLLQLGVLVKS